MDATLTKEDVTTLTRHFAPGEHEFLRGYTYIAEQAVTARLDEVDPAWTLTILDTHQRNEQIVVTVRLTIKGVSRDGVGMQKIDRGEKPDKDGVIKPFEVGEPEKGAATDALKRAARLFGIGRYLLELPDNVKEMQSLSKWLANQNGTSKPTGSTSSPLHPPTQPTPQTSENGKNGSDHKSITWPSKEALETVLTHMQRATGVIDMSMMEFARLCGILNGDVNDPLWEAFDSGKAAYEAAMKQFEAEQKKATPAQSKTFDVFDQVQYMKPGKGAPYLRFTSANHHASVLCWGRSDNFKTLVGEAYYKANHFDKLDQQAGEPFEIAPLEIIYEYVQPKDKKQGDGYLQLVNATPIIEAAPIIEGDF